MKHLFYIHSYITYIVAVSVVAELALDHRDVVFIYGRGFTYRDIPEINIVELPEALMALKVPSYGKRFFYVKNLRKIRKLDSLINSLIGNDKFTAYLPLTKNYLMQLIATHASCINLIFLEEGLLSYTGNFNKATSDKFTHHWRGKLAALARYPNHGNRSFFYRPYRYPCPIPIYMLHDAPDITEPNIDIRVLKSVIVPQLDPQFRINNGYLLVVDTNIEDGIVPLESYLSTLEILIDEILRKGIQTVWIRFRPRYPVVENIIHLFERNFIEVKIVPDEICIEAVFYYSKNLTVFGLHSSLLFYAAIWGHKSISLMNILLHAVPKAREYYASLSLPKIFFERVSLPSEDRNEYQA